MISKNTEYIPRLDHLRFAAAALVVAYHFAYGSIPADTRNPILLVIKQGYNGVSLFMVLSGFILTRICLHKEIDYRSFLFNRLLRIYPLYILIVFAAASSGGRSMGFGSFIALTSLMGNFAGIMPPRFPHIWTIMVEFQFYLVFPFLVRFFSRYGFPYIAGVVAIALLLRIVIFLSEGSAQETAYWTILGRCDQFAIGMAAAAIHLRWQSSLSNPIWLATSCAAFVGWVFAFESWCGGYYGQGSPHSPSVAWVLGPTLEALVHAALMLAYLQQQWRVPRVLDRALAYLGTISYSTYIWQLPIIVLFHKYFPDGPLGSIWANLFLIVLPTIVIVSSLSYAIVEKPFFMLRSVYAYKPLST